MRPTVPVETKAAASLRFLYHTVPGRGILWFLTRPTFSRLAGAYLSSRFSKHRIAPFIQKNAIDLNEFEICEYDSFNDFFARRIKAECRPVCRREGALISPCDAKLTAFEIDRDTVLSVKQSRYTISSLLKNEALASYFEGGYALIFRLCVDDYHRYAYAVSGQKEADVLLPGVLHTVRPVALENRPVFTQNARSYSLISTEAFGRVIQMEVGAMMVGKIVNHTPEVGYAIQGSEKGHFAFGGSTIILLFAQGAVELDREIIKNSQNGLETVVKYGEQIGESGVFGWKAAEAAEAYEQV